MNKATESTQQLATRYDNTLGQAYWNACWENCTTGWDIGGASPAITQYMAQYPHKNAAILIPGCGNAYEAEYLVANGFTNITLIDIAPKAVELLKAKFASTTYVRVLCEDFFQHLGHYDLIIEQTFFCALPPNKREVYVAKTASLLNDNGKVIGVLFNRTFEKEGPPFGGSVTEYKPLFETRYTIKAMDGCYNSIPPRANTEVFINLIKKQIQ